jgi:uncharacterized protein YyaL (SSP411 family)
MTASPSTTTNRLAQETSPYLLQHRTNPVDWWPWGPQALDHARKANKPILLSVGYAACHWCHVMAHESFEDPATAAVMNDLFVNIKVDREERPDIDQIYMAALHHLGEQGGWPLTMFLTPRGEPVWGGTYFPGTSRYGRPAFVDVLRELSRLFRDEPARIEQNRKALMQRLSERARPAGQVVIGRTELDAIARRLADAIDPVNGGLQGAPKFPQAALFECLWRAGLRTNDSRYFSAVELSLEHICEGGIYDHLGGGFSRYSVDERWLVPHFEKMLYDNAHLLELLALAWVHSPKPLYLERARETVDWLAREMTTPEDAFASSLDADSDGEEGKFYVWSLAEIERILGPDASFFAAHYDATPEGNFESHTILNRLKDLPRNVARNKADEDKLAALRSKLLAVRAQRVRPGLDDKVLADWNGQMIAALVQAGHAFGMSGWIERAATAFRFVSQSMAREGRLGHSWRDGRLVFPGLASDHAHMIRAALALHEATGAEDYLRQALVWQETLDHHYAHADGAGYFLTADDAEGLVVRPDQTADDAVANHNAIIAGNLLRLAAFTHDDRWRTAADRLFDALLPTAQPNLFGHAALLNALDLRLHAAEILVTGTGPRADALHAAALRTPFLNRTVLRATPDAALPAHHPAHGALAASFAAPAALICVAERCSLPVTEPAQIAQTVTSMRP